ncbi:DHA2 family efflux MFS transporter permease subunit [Nitratireductor sp. CAU 1489]|uniref:DHA2 family efflux MFS transporter permease subunit n=1 Tax=Nitratireductor arenosus TaxID=2682096 RepID=A0A844QCP3_9HYPH|nr:DHA2 family efflux MFS transporter permease subunit [Nitratireductor arenosus]
MPTTPPPVPTRLWALAATTGAGGFMAMLDSTVANLALESIRAGFDAPLASVQWVATAYLIALAVSLPLTGWFGRRIGQGRLWTASMVVFVAASLLCAAAQDMAVLVAGRCLQGLAAGLMVPAGQAVLAAKADARQLGRLMGTVGFAVALGPALGPALGGLLIELASWRWLFWINLPVGLFALFAARGLIAGGKRVPSERLDVKGLALVSPGLPLALFGAAAIAGTGGGVLPGVATVAGVLLLGGFWHHGRRAAAPLIDMRLLDRPGFGAAIATAGLTGAALYGGLLLLPLYLQRALGQPPALAGLMLLLLGLGAAVALPVAGALVDRAGAARISLAGSGLVVVATAVVPGFLSVLPLAGLLFLRGAGLALAQMPAMTAAYTLVDKAETGDAATLVNIAQRLGGALGAIIVVLVLESTAGAGGYRAAFAVLVAFSVGSLATARFLPGGHRVKRPPA